MTAEPVPQPDLTQAPGGQAGTAEPASAELVAAPEPAPAELVAAPEMVAAPSRRRLARERLVRARNRLATGLVLIGRTLLPIGLFAAGIALGLNIFGASRPAPAPVVGISEMVNVEAPPVVRELIASLETNDADATRAALGSAPYGLLAGELQEWGYQEVTDVETLGTFVDGTASTTAIVLRGHDANSRPLIINLIVQVEGGAIVSFR
jgi:hypothetical protein